MPFSRELYIERDDFMEDPPKKFFRLAPGREVRLRCAYFITCNEVVKDDGGEIVELRCTYDPATRGGDSPDGRNVRRRCTGCRPRTPSASKSGSTIGCSRSRIPSAADGKTLMDYLNPDSLEVLPGRRGNRAWAADPRRTDPVRAARLLLRRSRLAAGRLVFNRTVSLRDTWSRDSAKAAHFPRADANYPTEFVR